MSLTVKKVTSLDDLKKFVAFQNTLYVGHDYFVPKLFSDEMETLREDRNPAFEFCKSAYFLAYRDGKIVGRVAAIINERANAIWNHHELRFGWMDFIDDKEVSAALFDAVAAFGREHGLEQLVGPLGFTDFDNEGLLVEGFNHISTFTVTYNHPYYAEHLEALGFEKEVDWVEFKIDIPKQVPDRIRRISDIIEQKYSYKARKISKREVQKEGLGQKIFELLNKSYAHLYNFTPLSQRLVDLYIKTYLGILDMEYVCVVENTQKEIKAVGITMPSISKALQKCGGKLFPFGWFHILKSLYWKHEDAVELLLVAVDPDDRNKGLAAMILNHLVPRLSKGGFKYAESNPELENNLNVQGMWNMFDSINHKRRRCYTKILK